MKKIGLVVGVVLLAGAVTTAVVIRTCSGRSEGQDDGRCAPKPETEAGPEEIISTEGRQRTASIENASAAEFSKALGIWAEQDGIERKISWEAVRASAAAEKDKKTRIRGCQLAAALAAGKPKGRPVAPPADPKVVGPLMACLRSRDVGVVRSAVAALGTLHLNNPALKIEEEMLPVVRTLLADEDPELAKEGIAGVAVLKKPSLGPLVIDTWKRHEKSPGFGKCARQYLRILLELQERTRLAKEHPDWSRQKQVAEARAVALKKYEANGDDPAKWAACWAKPGGNSK
ncbi:MAG: HEAT repeat domain-containing protein [Planctomycetota bacterium]|jgi:hypothetical protein